ncbi:Galectin-9 [Varanus komodoensis]|nr:Galectin-9 [Varanus komodoensis]
MAIPPLPRQHNRDRGHAVGGGKRARLWVCFWGDGSRLSPDAEFTTCCKIFQKFLFRTLFVHSPFPPGPAYLAIKTRKKLQIIKSVKTKCNTIGNSLPVPYRVSIMGGIFPSKSIIVEGTPHTGATRFHINLKAGCNTVFHLNPRFNENVIVRNAKFNNSWGSEERFLPSGMPLSRGQPFSIWILCEMQRFRVAVNRQYQFDYNHRVPNLQQIDQLEVEGDVTLSKVQV